MKGYKFLIPAVALLALTGCAQKLNNEDRALLMQTQSTAQDARNQAAMAAQQAAQANASAASAAASARAASERADRIFLHSGNK